MPNSTRSEVIIFRHSCPEGVTADEMCSAAARLVDTEVCARIMTALYDPERDAIVMTVETPTMLCHVRNALRDTPGVMTATVISVDDGAPCAR